ncbi:MAG: beta-ketoacyl synthase N-terminal-like domain-containing protein [Bacteroidales bacterium]
MGYSIEPPIFLGADCMISSLGIGTTENYTRILNYEDGFSSRKEALDLMKSYPVSLIKEEVFSSDGMPGALTRLERLFAIVIKRILKESGLSENTPKLGFIFSTTKGNIDLLEGKGGLHPDLYLHQMASNVLKSLNSHAEFIVISNACISGVSAIIIGSRLIRADKFSHVVVVGGDLLSEFVITGFHAFRSVSMTPCRPYDEARDGLSLGEACGGVLLTNSSQIAVKPEVYVRGGAISNDANHISGPSRTGDGLFFAIQKALQEATLLPDDIGFINAHGTATLYNDEMESKALHLAALSDVPVNSLKSYLGHTLGASGVIETILSAYQLRERMVFGTKGFARLGVSMPLNLSALHRKANGRNCLKLASGFGGCNAALLLSLDQGEPAKQTSHDTTYLESESVLIETDSLNSDFGEFIREQFRALQSPNLKFYKMDDLCKLGYVAAARLFASQQKYLAELEPNEIALILANRSSSLDTDGHHQQNVDMHSEEGVSPAVFVYTLPNVVAGEIAIKHKIQGETTFFIQEKESEFLKEYAQLLLLSGQAKAVVYGWCEYLNQNGKVSLKIIKRK